MMFADKTLGQFSAALVRVGIALSACGLSLAAFAGEAATADQGDEALEEVVVTGTLIRGAPPTGSNVISVTQADIAASGASTTSQMLATIPQVANMFNGLPQVIPGAGSQLQVIRPNLRNTPSGNTATGAATLILVDGHRMVGVGISQSAPDPEAIPPGAIERVEVITDGGSSTYGSDAIGGVINYITRRTFQGVEVNARQGWADNYKTFDTNLTAGTAFGKGSVYFSYNYAKHDNILFRDRGYYKSINWATGQQIVLTCDNPNVAVGANNYPVVNGTVSQTPSTANVCTPNQWSDLYPSEARHTLFAGLSQDFTDSLKFDLRTFYTTRSSIAGSGPATATVTVNPTSFWYQNIAGASAGQSQNVQLSFAPALGNFSHSTTNKYEEWGVTPTITWDINGNWQLRGMANYGSSKTTYTTDDLNPTLLSTYGASTAQATALNVYNIALPSNAPLLANLRNWEVAGEGKDKITNLRAIVDGALFEMPGGKVRVAAGVEYLKDQFDTRTGSGALGFLGSANFNTYSRNVKSGFAELRVPLVGDANGMPGLRALDLSLASRYDKYSDFGNTTNPKFGLSYKPVDWMALRGNWGKSFNAPTPVDQLSATTNQIVSIPFQFFPFKIVPPGQPTTAGNGQNFLVLLGASNALQPQTAKTWSVGIDVSPPIVAGLTASLSYYKLDYKGALGKPPIFDPVSLVNFFPQYVTFNPTPAQIAAFAAQATNTITITPPIYSLVEFRTFNLGNSQQSGIDFNVGYTHDTSFGSVDGRVSGNQQRTYYLQASSAAPFADNIRVGQPVFTMSAQVGANIHKFRAQAIMNYTGGYNVDRTATTLQDHVSSFTTLNLFFRYSPELKGWLEDSVLSLSVNNALDQSPPILRTQGGNGYAGSIGTVGRLAQIGISKKF